MSDKTMADVADNAVEKLATAIEAAAEKAGPLAEQGWEALVAAERVSGIASVCVMVTFCFLTAVAFWLVRRLYVRKPDGELWVACAIVAATLACGVMIGIAINASDAVTSIVVPEAAALRLVIGK